MNDICKSCIHQPGLYGGPLCFDTEYCDTCIHHPSVIVKKDNFFPKVTDERAEYERLKKKFEG